MGILLDRLAQIRLHLFRHDITKFQIHQRISGCSTDTQNGVSASNGVPFINPDLVAAVPHLSSLVDSLRNSKYVNSKPLLFPVLTVFILQAIIGSLEMTAVKVNILHYFTEFLLLYMRKLHPSVVNL